MRAFLDSVDVQVNRSCSLNKVKKEDDGNEENIDVVTLDESESIEVLTRPSSSASNRHVLTPIQSPRPGSAAKKKRIFSGQSDELELLLAATKIDPTVHLLTAGSTRIISLMFNTSSNNVVGRGRPTSTTAVYHNSANFGRSSSTGITFNSSSRDRANSSNLMDKLISVQNYTERQMLPQALEKLKQKVAVVRSAMEQLKNLTILPQTELTSDFGLDKLDGERAKIRSASHSEARQLAESFLMSYRDLERRFEAQRRRMDALESRTARMETLFSEQIRLNTELGDEAVQALKRFVDDERELLEAVAEEKARAETQRVEMEKAQNKMELLDVNNQELKSQVEILNQEKSSISKKLLESQDECERLRMANEQMYHEMQINIKQIEANDAQVEELREQKRQAIATLDEKNIQIQQMLREKAEMHNCYMQEHDEHQKQMDRLKREWEQKLQEECALLESRHQAEQQVETERLQNHNTQKTLVESLQKASEAHRKLENERNRLLSENQQLKQNQSTFKRRFIAEVNRELTSMCTQLGTGVNTALMEVMVRLDHELETTDGNEGRIHVELSRLGEKLQQQTTPARTTTTTGISGNSSASVQTKKATGGNKDGGNTLTTNPGTSNQENHSQQHKTARNDEPIIVPRHHDLPNSPPNGFFDSDSSLSILDIDNNEQQEPTCSTANKNNRRAPVASIFQTHPSNNKKNAALSGKDGTGRRKVANTDGNKENVPMLGSINKKRPAITLVHMTSNEPPSSAKNKQVPVNVLAAAKPWIPAGQASQRELKKQQQQQQKRKHQQTPSMSTLQRQFGSPIHTSTPAKKQQQQFPAFHL